MLPLATLQFRLACEWRVCRFTAVRGELPKRMPCRKLLYVGSNPTVRFGGGIRRSVSPVGLVLPETARLICTPKGAQLRKSYAASRFAACAEGTVRPRLCRETDTARSGHGARSGAFRSATGVLKSPAAGAAWGAAGLNVDREVLNMRTIVINENQRGFLFKNGRFMRMLTAGKYRMLGGREIEVVSLAQPIESGRCALDTLLANGEVAASASVAEIADRQLALHFVNGRFAEALTSGRYAFWTIHDRHEYQLVDISSPEVDGSVPEYVFDSMPCELYTRVEVAEYQKARVFFNGKLARVLDAGTYYFWRGGVSVDADYVDTRLTKLDVSGQEIMTQDKVTVRVSFVCNYRVTDCVRILTEIDDYAEQLHVAVQLALRDYIGRCKLDDILANKDGLSKYVAERLHEKEKELFVEIKDAGVKDIILPGEVRDIMNTVLLAEKQAQANVVTRREEVASTRSLLNTAKLMEENQTLYRLKELEYIERICERVGNINLNGGGDILTQLTGIIRGGNS